MSRQIAGVFVWLLLGSAICAGEPNSALADPNPPTTQTAATQAAAPIDWARARALHQRAQRGETLTPEERAYLQSAIAARQSQNGRSGPALLGETMARLFDVTAAAA